MILDKKDVLWIYLMNWCKKYCQCHQMPERSFFIKGYQFPLCARCTGIALGHITAYIFAPFYTCKYIISIFMIPLIIDGSLQYLTSYKSNNKKRFFSGILYGFSFTSIIFRFFKDIIKKNKKTAPVRPTLGRMTYPKICTY